ncbi:MAG: PIN domain nuclease [Micromonosporaceae bacterium]
MVQRDAKRAAAIAFRAPAYACSSPRIGTTTRSRATAIATLRRVFSTREPPALTGHSATAAAAAKNSHHPAWLYLVDTSAIARIRHPTVREELDRLGRSGLLATCVTTDLEVLYSSRSPTEYATTRRHRAAGFTDLPLDPAVGDRARAIQALLARQSQHRVAGVVDLLTAAIAEHHSAIVLHYDADFDHIATVTGQQVRWVVPGGTVE